MFIKADEANLAWRAREIKTLFVLRFLLEKFVTLGLAFCLKRIVVSMARNGVLSSRWRSGKMEGLSFSSTLDDDVEEVHVLAVDDSFVDRKVIERMLRISSCKVTAVDSGRRALQFLGLEEDNNSCLGLKVDLIITDYCMPGMTGYELLKKIKESSTFKETPVVIMSSENVMARINRCLEEGAKDFIVKPVKLSDVKRLMDYMTARELRAEREEITKNINSIYINKRKSRGRGSWDDLSLSSSSLPTLSLSSRSLPSSISNSLSMVLSSSAPSSPSSR